LEDDQPPFSRSLESALILTGRKFIMRTFMISAASVVVLALSGSAFAQQGQFGTAAEAKALLAKAVAAVKADKVKALDMFAKGDGGFKDRDLYPFCFNIGDGKINPYANPNATNFGQDVRTQKDIAGKAWGLEFYTAAQKAEGQITEVSYMFPKPGADRTPVAKESVITRVEDLGCGVGYYK
jgi:hypothetical protein